MGQGYLYARPGSVDDTTRLLSLFAQKTEAATATPKARRRA